MLFKKIELFGFKSFADRHEITFDGGITAIVGPNGCGKSNIADAIRWVQGEQSSKLLRGQNMQDVIFAGTERRRQLGFCEVSIFFDNSQRTIPMDYNEVVVTRKLYRDGESEYLINKEQCRLKDIVNVLRDLGIGKEGYSIIGQGQVDKIINSKPEDRRAIFEEAAGISKHKAIRNESERKLERTQENLVRITDIRAEIERQYNPMQKQAENAKLYLGLKENLKHYEVNSYVYQNDKANEIKNGINERIKVCDEEIKLRRSQIESANEEYATVLRELNDADYDQKKFNDEILALTIMLEKTAGETKLVEERLNFMREQQKKFETDLKNIDVMQSFVAEQHKEKLDQILINKEQIEALNKDKAVINDNYLKIIDELTQGEDEVEISQRSMLESLNNLSDIKAEEARLEAELAALKEREIALKNEIAKCSITIENDLIVRRQSEHELNELNKNITYYESKNAVVTSELDFMQNGTALLEDEFAKNQGRLVSLQSRHKLLKDLQADNEGYAYSVRKLLEAGKADPKMKALFIGTVAQLFKTQEKYEVAIEMALAAGMQNVVVENEADAKKIIEFLKDNKFGRATMLPLTSVKPRVIEERFKAAIARASIGVATQLITYAKEYSNIFEMLLGGTVVCETLEQAIVLAKETSYGFKIVTLDGEVLETRGSIAGGSRKNEGTSILTRQREIETIEKEIADVFAIIKKQETEKQAASAQKSKAEKDKQEISEKLINLKIAKTKCEQNLAARAEVMSEQDDTKEKLKKELETNAAFQTKIAKDRAALKEAEGRLQGQKGEANASIEKRQKQFENLKQQKDLFNEKITEVKVKISALESENVHLAADCERLEGERGSLAEKQMQTNEALKKCEKDILACSQISFDLKSDDTKEQSGARLLDLKNRIENIGKIKTQAQMKLSTIEESRQQTSALLNKAQEKKLSEEIALSKVDTDIEFMQQRVFNEYELTYESALKYKEENYDFEAGEKEVAKLRREIFKLGAVNVNAIEDIRALEVRLNEYRVQEADLIKAKDDLLKIVKDLTNEMTEKFAREFFVISKNFSRVFKELFGGGTAELVLQHNETDPLSDGIEIVAQPPGKKLQSITLLSGGEKALTAIAILFAILRLRPMPFCVLDEIEAALDEANATRFAQYLRRFSQESQFIVITHRKPTMEEADCLYGVTMEEKGVSKMVSVTLKQAEEVKGSI